MNAPESRALVAQQTPDQAIDLFTSRGFDLACRIAKAFSNSDAVPAQFRAVVEKKGRNGSTYQENPAAIGNCIVAIETARSVGMSITSVMQQANVIEGKLTWSAQFQIAAINASGRFTPLQFKTSSRGKVMAKYREKGAWNEQKRGFDFTEKTVEIDDVECYAWAMAKNGNVITSTRIEGPKVSMKMAVEEGWYGKAGSKWQGEMAALMLNYRAGAFFARIHAPDIVMGMGNTAEEIRDTIDITPEVVVVAEAAPEVASPPRKAASVVQREEPEDAQYTDPVEPPRKAAPEPVETVPAHEQVATPEGDRGPQPESNPQDHPAPVGGEFMATTGEKRHLIGRVNSTGHDMSMLLTAIGGDAVDPLTLEGLTKEQFKLAKAKLS